MIGYTLDGFISGSCDAVKQFTGYIVKNINLQYFLYFSALIVFGFGDGITGAYLMEMRGVGMEANPFARYLFSIQGIGWLMTTKIGLTLAIICVTHITQLRSRMNIYWTVNGFMGAIIIGGMLAINANISAIMGNVPQPPGEIIFIYLFVALMLTELGSVVDKHVSTG